MPTTIEYKVIVVLIKEEKPYDFVAQAKGVVSTMEGNQGFPNPRPTLVSIKALIKAYEDCLPKGAATLKTRQERRRKLEQALDHLCDYAQECCEQVPIETAAAMAESVGMTLKRRAIRAAKAPIAVAWGQISGSVVVVLKALGRNVVYYVQYSLDGIHWSEVQLQGSKIPISGLTPGQTYQFRFRALKKNVYTDFSQPVTLLVK